MYRRDAAPEKKSGDILIYFTGAIGDFLLFQPLLRNWKKAFSESTIFIAAKPHVSALIDISYCVFLPSDDKRLRPVFAPQSSSVNEAETDTEFSALLDWCNAFHTVLFVSVDTTGSVRAFLNRLTCNAFLHPPFPAAGSDVSAHHQALVRHMGIPCDDFSPDLRAVCTDLSENIRITQDPYCIIHPGSGSLKKNWPIGHFIEISKKISSQINVLILLGPAEIERGFMQRLKPVVSKHVLVICNTGLHEVIHLCRHAAFYFGNDSGITHLAAACGTHVIAVIPEQNRGFWQYPAYNVTRLFAGDVLSEPSVSEVEREIPLKIFACVRSGKNKLSLT